MTSAPRTTAPPELPPPPRRWWIGVVYIVLFALSVPWYLPAAENPPIWLGLPYWVVLSLGGSLGVALFTALIVVRGWPQEPDPEPDGGEG